MKNIHIIPTDRPSVLYYKDNKYKIANSTMSMDWYISSAGYKPINIYITSDEEIRVNDAVISIETNDVFISKGKMLFNEYIKKIILTTDENLIKDGVQAIDDEFLAWFVNNPSCKFVQTLWTIHGYTIKKEYIIEIPKEEPKQDFTEEWKKLEDAKLCEPLKSWDESKQETLEEYIEKNTKGIIEPGVRALAQMYLRYGAKWQAERMYTEDEVLEIIEYVKHLKYMDGTKPQSKFLATEILKQFKNN